MVNTQETYRKLFDWRKDCYDMNNARNRCEYTKAKAQDKIKDGKHAITSLENKSGENPFSFEDNLITILDTQIEDPIDFIAEGYEQVSTKGGLRWVKVKV